LWSLKNQTFSRLMAGALTWHCLHCLQSARAEAMKRRIKVEWRRPSGLAKAKTRGDARKRDQKFKMLGKVRLSRHSRAWTIRSLVEMKQKDHLGELKFAVKRLQPTRLEADQAADRPLHVELTECGLG
jgi:hypothetical protein